MAKKKGTKKKATKKKGGKKKGRKKKRVPPAPLVCPPPDDPCPAQAEQCASTLSLSCQGSTACAKQIDCCAFLQTCDANGFFACLATSFT